MYPTLLIAWKRAQVKSAFAGQSNYTAFAVIGMTLPDRKDPSTSNIQSLELFKKHRLSRRATYVSTTTPISFTQHKMVYRARLGHHHCMVVKTMHVDYSMWAKISEMYSRFWWTIERNAPYKYFCVLGQCAPITESI